MSEYRGSHLPATYKLNNNNKRSKRNILSDTQKDILSTKRSIVMRIIVVGSEITSSFSRCGKISRTQFISPFPKVSITIYYLHADHHAYQFILFYFIRNVHRMILDSGFYIVQQQFTPHLFNANQIYFNYIRFASILNLRTNQQRKFARSHIKLFKYNL